MEATTTQIDVNNIKTLKNKIRNARRKLLFYLSWANEYMEGFAVLAYQELLLVYEAYFQEASNSKSTGQGKDEVNISIV